MLTQRFRGQFLGCHLSPDEVGGEVGASVQRDPGEGARDV
ncbi:hypothetical protein RISK_004468 [Rhodopirellula islandica]|uniref:Uncharacterized protein n=1 Tax=Rhodopirellula islandica TaxID=595434 RepID=A0A0J1BAQ0_RHOIS|nr:hypothetical protein RISK_004468 [Rhodopirellula islandica]